MSEPARNPPTLVVAPGDPAPAAIARAVDVLAGGGIVAYPTDTLYGLAVDPRNARAVRRLFDLKGRGADAAVPLIAASVEQAGLTGEIGPRERALASRYWPGPLTVVIAARPGLPPALLAGGATVAVRVPDHALARALAAGFGFCITATSANPSGQPAPSTAEAIDAMIRSGIDLVIDAGPTRGGPPSTIVDVAEGRARLIRPGAVPWDRVLEALTHSEPST
jgi:L-threonylcarbamoyladenylate synthase